MTAITSEVVRELLDYDPETGVLTWKMRDQKWAKSIRDLNRWNNRFAGTRAGRVWTNAKTGYQLREIQIFGKRCYEHRVIWLWMTDEPLPEQIDHRNQNATDNKWSNLRSSCNADNGRNQSKFRNNTSGVSGVSWHKQNKKWIAHCMVNNRLRHLGYFSDIADAEDAVSVFRLANGFDPAHGAEPAHYHA